MTYKVNIMTNKMLSRDKSIHAKSSIALFLIKKNYNLEVFILPMHQLQF